MGDLMNPKVEWVLKRPGYQRLLMLLGIVFLIVGLFVWMVFLPQMEEYSRLIVQDAKLKITLDSDQRKADNLPTFKAEYEKMLAQLDQALKQLPNGREIPELLTSISSRAKESGLNVQSFRPGSEKPIGFYAEVPVSLKFEGTFHQVANFFYAVSTLPRIVNINKVKIGNKSGNKTDNNVLSVDCLAITFRFLENSTQAGAGGK
jgi:type IV pilus assembly protein PilO